MILASTPGTPALVPAPGSRSRSPRQGRDFLWRNNTAITLAWKPAPLLTHCLLTRPIPASAFGHDQVPQVDGRVQVPVMPGSAVGAGPCAFPLQFRVHGAAGAAGPAAGKPHGARITRVWRHWPLASSSRAGSPYPRHLARALDFPGSAHPRQERGGARLSQHGVTAPDDDAGTLISKATIRSGIRIPSAEGGLPGRFHHPCHGNGQSRPVTEHRPPAWGQ